MLEPQDEVSEREVQQGLRALLVDASFATAIGALNGSVANSDTVSKIGLMYCQGQLR